MDLGNLKPAKGSVKSSKRIARGQGSGHGGTATRGHKGAKSRSGYSRKLGFEGGQMPLYRRVPKGGFKNINRVEYTPVNIENLEKISQEKGINVFDFQVFCDLGIVSKNDKVKVLGRGELNSKIEVSAHAFSKSAQEAIEAKGGVATKI
jgi:large subunit ribosomal protein L15